MRRICLILLLCSPLWGQASFSGNVKVGGNILLSNLSAAACGPPTFNCSTQATFASGAVTPPSMGGLTGVNTTGYSYSSPGDSFYPSSGTGNCWTRLTDSNTRSNAADWFSTWSGGAADLMWDVDRDYGLISSSGGNLFYISVSYDANGCMHVNNPVIPPGSSVHSGGGVSASRVTNAVFYHVQPPDLPSNGTALIQDTVSGTSTISISSTTIFDFAQCPGVPVHASVGGNGGLTVSSDDTIYTTNLNLSSVPGQGSAHWLLSWNRTTNACTSYYTGQVSTTENPASGNVWAACVGNCNQAGSNPAPLGLSTACPQPGFGMHGSQMAKNGLYVSTATTDTCVQGQDPIIVWQIGTLNFQYCDAITYDCQGHNSIAYSTWNLQGYYFTRRSVTDISHYTDVAKNYLPAFCCDQHGATNWIGSASDVNPWMLSTTLDTATDTCTTYAYCYELIALRLDGVFVRFAPNYYTFTAVAGQLGPVATMTQDGYCMIVGSNWNETLGNDGAGQPRVDLFSICNLQ
jgi:hypothetical protein